MTNEHIFRAVGGAEAEQKVYEEDYENQKKQRKEMVDGK